MKINSCEAEGVFILEPETYLDQRGYFCETYQEANFLTKFPKIRFVQDNESFSKRNVLRGLHFQTAPFAQSKLVRAVSGKIFDVIIDIRSKSKTFGKYFSFELSGENKHQLFVPAGFAHGFLVLSETAIVQYKVDRGYSKANEGGLRFDDSELKIPWPGSKTEFIVSDKDRVLPNFRDLPPFDFG